MAVRLALSLCGRAVFLFDKIQLAGKETGCRPVRHFLAFYFCRRFNYMTGKVDVQGF
jgi:hypothetical protein